MVARRCHPFRGGRRVGNGACVRVRSALAKFYGKAGAIIGMPFSLEGFAFFTEGDRVGDQRHEHETDNDEHRPACLRLENGT